MLALSDVRALAAVVVCATLSAITGVDARASGAAAERSHGAHGPLTLAAPADGLLHPYLVSHDAPEGLRPASVTPPGPEAQVLSSFDALAACAAVDLDRALRETVLRRLQSRPTVAGLARYRAESGSTLAAVRRGQPVAPLLLDRLPADLNDSLEVRAKKRGFIALMLPHILAANAEVAAKRQRILSIRDRFDDPTGPDDAEIAWLFETFEAYRVDDYDLDRLLARVDVVPPALAIAQAAKESGWGTSRFSQQGNALYGQWTWNPAHKGIVPKERPRGKTYRVRAFDDILSASRAYVFNLNTTGAYGRFREMRRKLRGQGKTPTGLEFAGAMDKYSTIGQRYVRALRRLIKANDLVALNAATLRDDLPLPTWPKRPSPAAAGTTIARN